MSEAGAINGSDKGFYPILNDQAASETQNLCIRLSQEFNQKSAALTKPMKDPSKEIAITECAIVGAIAAAVVTHRMYPQAFPAIKQMLGFGAKQCQFIEPAMDVLINSGMEINPITRSLALTRSATDALISSGIEINPITRSTLGSAWGREAAVRAASMTSKLHIPPGFVT